MAGPVPGWGTRLALLLVLFLPGIAAAQATPTIQGRVVDLQDRPLSGVEIVLTGVRRTVATNAAGRFVFDSLSVREYILTARLPGYNPTRARIQVRAGGPTEVEITLEPRAQVLENIVVEGNRRGLYGVVGDSANQPIAGAAVEVYGGNARQVTDSTGRFAFPQLRGGDYLVSATAAGLPPKLLHVTVPRQGAIEVVLLLAPSGVRRFNPPGMQFIYHDLGMRLSMHPASVHMNQAELARHAGRQLCDIAKIRSQVIAMPMVVVDGITTWPEMNLCSFSADDVVLVELTCAPASGSPRLRAGQKARCIRIWTR